MLHRQLKHDEAKQKFADLHPERRMPLVLIANDVRDPRNLGALFRLADAAGIAAIYILGADALREDKVRRVARSADRHISVQTIQEEELAVLKQTFELVALEITSNSIPYTDYRPTRAVALIIGNEQTGIQATVLEQVDQAIHIPMYGRGSSMNVAVAAGIAVYGLMNS